MKRICIFHVIFILFCELFGPSFGEVISQVQVVDAWTYLTGAYYLSADGVLYSPGADTDASDYAYYRDEYHWIVAENVASFGHMTGGLFHQPGRGTCLLESDERTDIGHYKDALLCFSRAGYSGSSRWR